MTLLEGGLVFSQNISCLSLHILHINVLSQLMFFNMRFSLKQLKLGPYVVKVFAESLPGTCKL